MKWLSIVDEYTRECVALEVARSQTSEDVIDALAIAFAIRGAPQAIRSDNGPEFIAQAIQEWLARLSINGLYIAPGSPWEDGYAKSFHSKLVDEFLSREEFENVSSAKKQTAEWRHDYNHARPHSSLGYLTTAEFASRWAASALGSASPRPALPPPIVLTQPSSP